MNYTNQRPITISHSRLQCRFADEVRAGRLTAEQVRTILGWYRVCSIAQLSVWQAKSIHNNFDRLIHKLHNGEPTMDKRFCIITANAGNISCDQKSSAPRTFYATFAEAEEAASEIVRNGWKHGVYVVRVEAKVELAEPPVKTTKFGK